MSMKLNYLFTAEFIDGSILKQTQEDISLLDPKRNQFYDVLNSGKELKCLTYIQQKIWNPTIVSVDLETGNFILNGVEIISEPIIDKNTGKEIVIRRKPIRYMNVKKHFNATYQIKSGNILDMKELQEERIFYIGWQVNIEGKNYQQIIGVK